MKGNWLCLDDVKMDAIKKAQGKEVTEQVYAAIIQMQKVANYARKEGLLDLEKEAQSEPELRSLSILQMGVEYIASGMDYDIITEVLTTKYWVKNPQGMEALTCYICILGLLQIEDIGSGDLSPYAMELILTALLPEECMEEYERQKEKRMPKQVEKTLLEQILEREPKLPRRSTIISNILEEKINQATDAVMKAGIAKLESTDHHRGISIVLRGLNRTCKEKLLSFVSPTRRNIILEDEQYMGPIRVVDIEDAMVGLLECFEEVEREVNNPATEQQSC